MSLQIIVKSNLHPREEHPHACPYCRRVVIESNEVCQKTLVGTGLSKHTFVCFICQQDLRARLSADWLDGFIGEYATALSTHVIPQKRVDEREEREIAAGNSEIGEIADLAKKI